MKARFSRLARAWSHLWNLGPCHLIKNDDWKFPILQIDTLIYAFGTLQQDISKTIWAKGLKFGQLTGDDESIIWLKLKKKKKRPFEKFFFFF